MVLLVTLGPREMESDDIDMLLMLLMWNRAAGGQNSLVPRLAPVR